MQPDEKYFALLLVVFSRVLIYDPMKLTEVTYLYWLIRDLIKPTKPLEWMDEKNNRPNQAQIHLNHRKLKKGFEWIVTKFSISAFTCMFAR